MQPTSLVILPSPTNQAMPPTNQSMPPTNQAAPTPNIMQPRPIACSAPTEQIFIPGDWFYGKNITIVLSKTHTAVLTGSEILINGIFDAVAGSEPELFEKDDVLAAYIHCMPQVAHVECLRGGVACGVLQTVMCGAAQFAPRSIPQTAQCHMCVDIDKPLFFPTELLNIGNCIEVINDSHFLLKSCGMYEISWNIAVDPPCKLSIFLESGSILGVAQKEIQFAMTARTIRKKQLIGQVNIITNEPDTVISLRNTTIPLGLRVIFNDDRVVSTIVIRRLLCVATASTIATAAAPLKK